MTVITLTTVGFREVRPLDTSGQVFTIVLILMGVGLALVAVSLIARLVADPDARRPHQEETHATPHRPARRPHDHLRVRPRRAARSRESSQRSGAPFLVIDPKEELRERMAEDGVLFLIDDPSSEAVLKTAGVGSRTLARLCGRFRRDERLHHPDRAVAPTRPHDRGARLRARLPRAARACRRGSGGLAVRHERPAHGHDGDPPRGGRRRADRERPRPPHDRGRGAGTSSTGRPSRGDRRLRGRHPVLAVAGRGTARSWRRRARRPSSPQATRCCSGRAAVDPAGRPEPTLGPAAEDPGLLGLELLLGEYALRTELGETLQLGRHVRARRRRETGARGRRRRRWAPAATIALDLAVLLRLAGVVDRLLHLFGVPDECELVACRTRSPTGSRASRRRRSGRRSPARTARR